MLPFIYFWHILYAVAKTIDMEKLVKLFRYFSNKKFSTIAGTLVYFLLMSITPLLLWLTLLFGKINLDWILSHSLFSGASPFISYLKQEAEGAASSAGIVLLVTTLYSSTNFFYHLRRSGEIIYDCNRKKGGGIKLRLFSLVLIFALIVFIAIITAVGLLGGSLFKGFMPKVIVIAVNTLVISTSAFMVALIFNKFICPYKVKTSEVLTGSLITTALWLIVAAGFNVYLQLASPEKLYGKIAVIFVFLLWCYVMMCCLVIGVIYNAIYKRGRVLKSI